MSFIHDVVVPQSVDPVAASGKHPVPAAPRGGMQSAAHRAPEDATSRAALSLTLSPKLSPKLSPTLSHAVSQALSRALLRLRRLAGLAHRFGGADEPGTAVLRDLGLDRGRPGSAFDWVGFHQGSEPARLRRSGMDPQGWRGS